MTAKPFQFEAALAELEEITRWFESSDVDLDAGLAKFERGMELAAQLKQHLQSVENRVEKIKARFGDSAAPVIEAADAEPSSDDVPPELFTD
jgi:exodeoxyribonuclease VII small subunit